MAQPTVVDVATISDIRRLAEEVRDTQAPVVLRSETEELAVLMPISGSRRRRQRQLTQAEYDAVMSAASSWTGLIDDVDTLKSELKAARG